MLVLASASNARRNLLINAHIPHKVIVSDVDENKFEKKNALSIVDILAFHKSSSVVKYIQSNQLKDNSFKRINAVLGCDSMFEFEGNFFGKPRNSQEAVDRLKKFSSGTGYIHTGHCLFSRKSTLIKDLDFKFDGVLKEVITTEIKFSVMSDEDIINYVNTREPLNCAGGFALDGIGGMFIREINGCYSNVIGLSLPWLRKSLEKFDLLDEMMKKKE